MERVNRWAGVRRACGIVCAALTLASPARADRVRVGPYLHDLGATRVEIRLETSGASTLEVELERAGDPKSARRVVSKDTAMHTFVLDGLEPRTRYAYTVRGPDVSAKGELVTAPPADSLEPFTLLAYGDNRTDDTAHAAIVQAMARTPSDFLVHTGDLLDDARHGESWSRFFEIEGTLLRDRCLFPCVGNHDLLDDGVAYKRYLGPLDGSMRWQFARFWFVNAMDDSPYRWLLEDLAAHDDEPGVVWRVVVLHQGPYASGPHGPLDMPARALEVWRAHKVDLVVSGHDHIYERGVDQGLRYVVTGGGGAPPYPIERREPTTRKAESSRHFVELRFSKDDVRLVAHRIDGTTIEERSFTKDQGWDDDPKRAPLDRPDSVASAGQAETQVSRASWIAPGLVFGILILLLVGGRFYRKGRS